MRLRLRDLTPLVAAAALSACASQPHAPPFMYYAPLDRLPAVLLGFFHGFLAPLTLLLSLIGDARIYSWPNGGWPYDLGFVLGFTTFVTLVSSMVRRPHR